MSLLPSVSRNLEVLSVAAMVAVDFLVIDKWCRSECSQPQLTDMMNDCYCDEARQASRGEK